MSSKVKIHILDGKYINLYDITMYEVIDQALVISLINREPLVFNVPSDIPDLETAVEELHAKMLELETVPVTMVSVVTPVVTVPLDLPDL